MSFSDATIRTFCMKELIESIHKIKICQTSIVLPLHCERFNSMQCTNFYCHIKTVYVKVQFSFCCTLVCYKIATYVVAALSCGKTKTSNIQINKLINKINTLNKKTRLNLLLL